MNTRRSPNIAILSGAVFALLLVVALPASAQSSQKGEVEAYVREWYEAWASGDVDRIARVDVLGPGFGVRTFDARPVGSPEFYKRLVESFLSEMEYYKIWLDKIETAVDGDIGLAWGVHTEEFRVRGRSPEKIRVRFTMTLQRGPAGWRPILVHRDAQPFGSDGRYLPGLENSAAAPPPR
jgi:ketosteroid isomerase-like protein